MTQGIQRFTKRNVNVLVVLIGLAVVSSILIYSGCGMTSSPNIPTNQTQTPTPTPTPAPTPTPDTPPTSTITSPKEGAIVLIGTQVAITGTASDAGGGSVVRVEVSVDGVANYSAAAGTNAWSFNWTPSALGPATIKSRAVDNSGNVQNPPAEIHVTVDAPPTSTITSPTAGATALTDHVVNITGTASDTGGGTVARVEVSVDGGANYNAATGTTPWSYNWTPTLSGSATIKSRAIDNSGIVQDPPAAVTVTVLDTTPPTSIITSPATGGIVPRGTTLSVTGTASDAGGGSVANVEVSVNGGATWKVATGTTLWNYNWTPTTPGPATIKSRAVDDSGNQQNPPVEITVTVRLPIRVPSEQPTIRSAINVATDGDTVLVAPGTYVENINFGGKAITVTSEGGPEVTIIDGGNVFAPVVRFISGEGRGSALNGFTLQNGRLGVDSPVKGGGIVIQSSSPTITNNVIRNNQACNGSGIGIDSFGSPSGSSPLIQRNTITGNTSLCAISGGGGGI